MDVTNMMMLQWGRAPMSAEMRAVAFANAMHAALQWGRAPMSAEIQM